MMAIIDGQRKEVPEKLTNRVVQRVMPLDFLNSEYARKHHRLQVFGEKGTQCVVPGCTCKGVFLAETAQVNKKDGKISSIHIDLYTEDFQLMTVDHHIALSKGGSDHIDNKFPMCERHNSKKSSKDPEVFYANIALNGGQSTAKKWRRKNKFGGLK